jgi:methylated-DNA-[protein]-cysteine S-methyltransferase
MFYSTLQSPLGLLTFAADHGHLRQLHIQGDQYFSTIPKDWVYMPHLPVLRQARDELIAYFKGERFGFSVPVAFDGTAFQNQVWKELRIIAPGMTLTYAELAVRVNRPKAVRAVGTAVGRNPLCIIIPCHRVTASGGGLGGYVAGLNCKKYLLEHEQR